MNKKRAIIVISIFLLVFIFGFAIIYSYLNARLTERSVRIVGAGGGIFNHGITPLPEGIQLLTQEEFLLAMEEETRALTDEAFRLAIERQFNPNNTALRFNNGDELDPTSVFRGDDSIHEREEVSGRIFNVLFLGDDARIHQNRGRSDTIILISFNRDTRVITLTSFMRDILIPTSYNSTIYWNRINLMHAIGGPGRIINHLNALFSLDIQQYAIIRFSGVFTLVDALEGLELSLTDAEAAAITRIFPDFDAVSGGDNVLNGRQVLAYSRLRAIDNDLVRTQRQRNVLTAIFDKILDTRHIGDVFTIATFVMDHVETNVPLNEIIRIGLDLFAGSKPIVQELRIPIDGSYNHALYNNAYILTIDFEENITALHETIYSSADDLWIPDFALPDLNILEIELPRAIEND